jgi:hypothetical protein
MLGVPMAIAIPYAAVSVPIGLVAVPVGAVAISISVATVAAPGIGNGGNCRCDWRGAAQRCAGAARC